MDSLHGFELEQFVFSSLMLVHAPSLARGDRITEASPLESPWAYPVQGHDRGPDPCAARRREGGDPPRRGSPRQGLPGDLSLPAGRPHLRAPAGRARCWAGHRATVSWQRCPRWCGSSWPTRPAGTRRTSLTRPPWPPRPRNWTRPRPGCASRSIATWARSRRRSSGIGPSRYGRRLPMPRSASG